MKKIISTLVAVAAATATANAIVTGFDSATGDLTDAAGTTVGNITFTGLTTGGIADGQAELLSFTDGFFNFSADLGNGANPSSVTVGYTLTVNSGFTLTASQFLSGVNEPGAGVVFGGNQDGSDSYSVSSANRTFTATLPAGFSSSVDASGALIINDADIAVNTDAIVYGELGTQGVFYTSDNAALLSDSITLTNTSTDGTNNIQVERFGLQLDIAAVPEPSSTALLGLGGLALLARRKRA